MSLVVAPNGGDGGKGGNVILHVSEKIDTLLDITSKVKFIAEDGGKGQNSNKNGKDGKDLIINIPKGTLVKDLKTGRIIKDLKRIGESIRIVRGGKKAGVIPTLNLQRIKLRVLLKKEEEARNAGLNLS